MKQRIFYLFSWIFLFTIFNIQILFPENIRGPLTHTVTVKIKPDFSQQLAISSGEFIAVYLEQDSPLLTGLQVEIVVADKIKQYADNFAIEIFNQVDPVPEKDMFTFTGDKIFFQILPYRNTVYVRIPLQEDTVRKGEAEAGHYTLNSVVPITSFPVLFTVQAVLKGIPDSVLLRDFHINIKPQLLEKGYLDLVLKKPESISAAMVELYIDDIRVEYPAAEMLLDAGIHSLTMAAPDCKEENSSFFIETGQTTRLELELEPTGAQVRIDILPGTLVFIDGNIIETLPEGGLALPEGNHTFRFKIGDYSVTKSIYTTTGKQYNISLFFTVDVKEN